MTTKKKRYHSLSTTILLGILGTGLLGVLAFSTVLYKVQAGAEETQLAEIAGAILKPIESLATRGVNGGNAMKLRGKDAQFLYASSGVQYLKISGTSMGSPKTLFSPEMPPAPVNYNYVGEGVDGKRMEQIISRVNGRYLDKENWVYVVRTQLSAVENGGTIEAVFSAERLKGLVWRTIKSVIPVSVGVLLVTLLVAVLIGRWISKPIVATSVQIKEISDSLDLSSRVEVSSQSEVGETAAAFNQLLDKLQEIMRQVDDSTVHLNQAAEKLSITTNAASRRIIEEEGETQQVVVAMNEMVAVVENVSRNAGQAATSAANANATAASGKDVVGKTVAEINNLAGSVENAAAVIRDLSKDSEDIGGVMDVIRGIAEQTNLLALNAAIEAARAGETGRGFAVVADEVRSLASRTQQSTREIQVMIERLQSGSSEAIRAIEGGQQQTEVSVIQAKEAGASLDLIAEAVGNITEKNVEIASNSREQAAASEEINRSITRISELSKHAAADSRETAEASERLTMLSESLRQLVSRFKT